MTMTESVWQTVGPFFHTALPWKDGGTLAREGAQGERIRLVGRILDGMDSPVADAMVEVWQANAAGRYRHPEDDQDKPLDLHFDGFGRTVADANGAFIIDTVKPGRVPGPGNRLQAPHLNVSIFARGLVRRVVTRVYFAGDLANVEDPILDLVEDAVRRRTLVAEPSAVEPGTWLWTVRFQGEGETVFFDI